MFGHRRRTEGATIVIHVRKSMKGMEKHPLISVIVPVYNVEQWLPRCIDSIRNQTYQNLEIICVDDASPDACGALLDEYARHDSRIKVLHQENKGLSGARNAGLALATGEWVTGVDSDDYLLPDIYERAVECLNDSIDLLLFGTEKVDEEDRPLSDVHQSYFSLPEEGRYPVTPALSRAVSACFVNKIWRRSIISETGIAFPLGLVHEDEAFLRLFLPYARFYYALPHIGYRYLMRDNSIMAQCGVLDAETSAGRHLEIAAYLEKFYASAQVKGEEYLLSFLWLIYLGYERRAPLATRRIAEMIARMPKQKTQGDFRAKRMLSMKRSLLNRLVRGYSERFQEWRLGKLSVFRLWYDEGHLCGWEIFPQIIKGMYHPL